MNKLRIRLAATLFLLAAGSLFVLAANAEDAQAPLATDAGSEDAGALDANIDGDADAAAPPLSAFDALPFPEEKSPKPKKEEWKNAPQVAFSKGSSLGSFCKAYRIREWIRIRCESSSLVQIVVRSGNPEEVSFVLDPSTDEWLTFPPSGEVVFPVRRGDRRLIEWTEIEWGYKGAKSARTGLLISELWLPDEEKPTIIAR